MSVMSSPSKRARIGNIFCGTKMEDPKEPVLNPRSVCRRHDCTQTLAAGKALPPEILGYAPHYEGKKNPATICLSSATKDKTPEHCAVRIFRGCRISSCGEIVLRAAATCGHPQPLGTVESMRCRPEFSRTSNGHCQRSNFPHSGLDAMPKAIYRLGTASLEKWCRPTNRAY